MASLFTSGKFQAINALGVVPGAQLFTYAAGTTTAQATYTDQGGLSSNTNPVVCDALGQASVWLGSLAYRMILKDASGVTIWDVDNVTPGVTFAQLFPRTSVEVAASVTPASYFYAEGDIRRYGALTSASNNAVAINLALTVSANGGAAAFIPPGMWAYTATLNATLVSSMYGVGRASILAPNGCDGITFTNQGTTAGPRFFKSFLISGTSTTANNGIYGSMLVASGNRVTGITFSDVMIQNFGTGVNMVGGWWNCTFRDCYLYNNYQGFTISEQCAKTTLDTVSVVKGSITGAGTQYAVNILQSGSYRPEDVTLIGCYLFGYDWAVFAQQLLYGAIEHCDMDDCQVGGVRISGVNGGFSVRDSYIATQANVATTGILIDAQGSAIREKVFLENNDVVCNTAHTGSVGIQVGTLHLGVVVNGNRVDGFVIGIYDVAADNFVAKFNSINATTTAIKIDSLSANIEIGPNYIQAGTAMLLTGATPPGFAYYSKGSFTGTLTGMTGSTTGTVNYVANGHVVQLQLPTLSGTSNTTAMTMTGLPAELFPVSNQGFMASVTDSGSVSTSPGYCTVDTSGVITFTKTLASGAFTNSGTKGHSTQVVSYPYL